MDRALWAGAGVRLSDGAGVVEFALHPGGYVRFGEEWVLIAHPRAPRGPLTVVVTGLHRAPLALGERAEVRGGELRVGTLRVDLGRVLAGSGRAGASGAAGATGAAPLFPVGLAAELAAAPPPPAALADGLRALAACDLAAAVRELAGRGEGLTPVGDDVLAGYAAMRHAMGRPVFIDTDRCSPLGRAYLRCAERGQLPDPPLSRWGASSGTAMLWGMRAAA